MIRGDASLCEDFFSYRTLEVVQDYYPEGMGSPQRNPEILGGFPDSSSKNMTRPKEGRVRGFERHSHPFVPEPVATGASFQPSIRSGLVDCIIFILPPCPLAGAGRASHARGTLAHRAEPRKVCHVCSLHDLLKGRDRAIAFPRRSLRCLRVERQVLAVDHVDELLAVAVQHLHDGEDESRLLLREPRRREGDGDLAHGESRVRLLAVGADAVDVLAAGGKGGDEVGDFGETVRGVAHGRILPVRGAEFNSGEKNLVKFAVRESLRFVEGDPVPLLKVVHHDHASRNAPDILGQLGVRDVFLIRGHERLALGSVLLLEQNLDALAGGEGETDLVGDFLRSEGGEQGSHGCPLVRL